MEVLERAMGSVRERSRRLGVLSSEEMEEIVDIVVKRRMSEELDVREKLQGVDYRTERDIFLMSVSKISSPHTVSAYKNSLRKLEDYCRISHIEVFLMTYKEADDFIYQLSGSPNTKRLAIASISSFFSFLERRYSIIKNPMRGTKARPKFKVLRPMVIPSKEELNTILSEMEDEATRMALLFLSLRGFRVGALARMEVLGTRFRTFSKGREISGSLPPDLIALLNSSSLDKTRPFSSRPMLYYRNEIIRICHVLWERKRISWRYTPHSFRHYFAVREYERTKDIYSLSKLLDHSSISMTESYLRALKIDM